MKFDWAAKGKAIPPPHDRKPSLGSVKEMPSGPIQQEERAPSQQSLVAAEYVNDLIDRASNSVNDMEEEEDC